MTAHTHTHTHTHPPTHTVGLLWMRDRPVAWTSTDNAQRSNRTNTRASGGIRTHNPNKRATANPRHRPHGQKVLKKFLNVFNASSLTVKFSFYSSCYFLLLLFYFLSFSFFLLTSLYSLYFVLSFTFHLFVFSPISLFNSQFPSKHKHTYKDMQTSIIIISFER